MTRPVHVVAFFNQAGKAQPLYFKLALDGPTYKVNVLSMTEDKLRSYSATYYCTTMSRGKEIELQLVFYAYDHYWQLVMSNTRAHNFVNKKRA